MNLSAKIMITAIAILLGIVITVSLIVWFETENIYLTMFIPAASITVLWYVVSILENESETHDKRKCYICGNDFDNPCEDCVR